MKFNRREIVLLLNGLIIQQDYYHKQNPDAPRAVDFTSFEDAYALIMEEQAEEPMAYPEEYDNLFSKLVYQGMNDLSPEEELLFNLPPTELQ